MTFNVVKSFSSFIIINGDTCKCTKCNRVYKRDTKDKNYWRSVICGHTDNKEVKSSANNFNNLKGRIFGNWAVLQYSGERMWQCECLCSKHTLKEVSAYSLTSGKSLSCGQCNSVKSKVNVGDHFGEWTVVALEPKYKALCECSCEAKTRKSINIYSLLNGTSTSCGKGHDRNSWNVKDLTGMKFGDLTALEYIPNSKGRWLCKCECGNFKIAQRSHLLDGRAHCCADCSNATPLIDLKGLKFGKLTPKKYLGNKLWLCDCDCGNERVTTSRRLRKGRVKSCGCLILEQGSLAEKSIAELFPGCIRSNRDIIAPQELDIYIPDTKTAIEYNGIYWHSNQILEDMYFHQNKSLKCYNKGIRLIHIFEHEWANENTRAKILNIIDNNDKKYIDNDDIEIAEIDYETYNCVKEIYSLSNEDIKVDICLGIFSLIEQTELIGVASFTKIGDGEFRLVDICLDDSAIVENKLKLIIKYMSDKYNATTIRYICDFGKNYTTDIESAGFTLCDVTEPNAHFVHHSKFIEISEEELASKMTDINREEYYNILSAEEREELIRELGYHTIYDSGNAVFVWEK